MKRILVIPWALGIGDLVRHDPLLRGIKEKHPDSEIGLFALKNNHVMHYHPCVHDTFFVWCSRCDYIYNCNPDGQGVLETILQDKGKYQELFGYTGEDTEAIREFDSLRKWEDGFDVVYKRRQASSRNLSEWFCRICGVTPSDPEIQFFTSTESNEIGRAHV